MRTAFVAFSCLAMLFLTWVVARETRLEPPQQDPVSLEQELLRAELNLEDTAWALRALFFRADLGPEWVEHRGPVAPGTATTSTLTADGSSAPASGRYALPFAPCLGAAGGPLDPAQVSTVADSARFVRHDGAFALSSTLVTTSPEAAAALFTRTLDPGFAACVGERTADNLEGDARAVLGVEGVAMPPLADELHGFRVTSTHDEGDGERVMVMEGAVVRIDRALLAFLFAAPGQPVAAVDRDAVTAALVSRLQVLPVVPEGLAA